MREQSSTSADRLLEAVVRELEHTGGDRTPFDVVGVQQSRDAVDTAVNPSTLGRAAASAVQFTVPPPPKLTQHSNTCSHESPETVLDVALETLGVAA